MDKRKKISLTSWIFAALIAGALVGIFLHFFVPSGQIKDEVIVDGVLYIVGNAFIRGMQMLVVPLVFCSLITGTMAIGDTKTLGRVGVKTILFYLATTAIAIILALILANITDPGIGLNRGEINTAETLQTIEKTSFKENLLNIIPKNPIAALAEGNMLQIIFFALVTGIILAKSGKRTSGVAAFFEEWNEIMMKMTIIVMRTAPIGVFCLIAKTFSEIGLEAFVPLLKYIVTTVIVLLLQCFVIYMLLLKVFTGLNPILFIKKFLPVMEFAFSTATSNATIPISIDILDKRIGVSRKISSFTIPLGATVNMDGTAIMQGVAVVFVAQAYHAALTPVDYLTIIATALLASIGTAGIPSVGLITLSMVFSSVGLPVEGIALIMGIDRIIDMARTAVNVTGDAVCTTIIASQNGELNREVFAERNMN